MFKTGSFTINIYDKTKINSHFTNINDKLNGNTQTLQDTSSEEHTIALNLANQETISEDLTSNYDNSFFDDSICVYSFALNPEKNNPSGSCNFSRINKSTIKYHLNKLNNDESIDPPNLMLFAINYNILQVKNGSGHLIYSK